MSSPFSVGVQAVPHLYLGGAIHIDYAETQLWIHLLNCITAALEQQAFSLAPLLILVVCVCACMCVMCAPSYPSVHFTCSVVSDSLWPHELQHARPPCPSPTPGVHPNSCPSNRWCHPAISSSVVPFSSCPQSLPASESFPMSQLFASGGQSFSFSISPSNEHPGLISFRMDWLDLLAVQGTLKSLL